MFSSLLSRPSVSVTVEQEMIFVRPPDRESGIASEDPELRGTVLLSLPAPRAVRSVRVVFEGLCDAYGGNGWKYESSTALHKFLDLELGDEVLAAGNHAFNFSFIIPSSTAVYQRSTFGRVRHYVKSNIEFSTGFTSSLTSDPVALWISAVQTSANEPPRPLDICVERFSEDLGPIGIGVSSTYLCVAGLLSLRVNFLGATTDLTIDSIKASVEQTFAIQYEDGRVATPTPKRHVLPSASPTLPSEKHGVRGPPDPEFPINISAGEERRLAWIMRVPDDDLVRPTTLDGTETRIRVSHVLSTEVVYRTATGSEDVSVTIRIPIKIASCCSRIESLFLPAYSHIAPTTIIKPVKLRCLCNLSLGEMYDRVGAVLQRAGSVGNAEHCRVLGMDGGLKSPMYQEDVGRGTEA